ncbi:MAG: glycosyltransferase [Patescibacteria group bacterium]
MKLFLIKLGKAWSVIRRDGLLRGSSRVLSAFGLLFRKVEPGDVLFVSNGVGDSARYRTSHVAEELSFHGFKASVALQDNPFLLSYAKQFSVFVFHRVLFTEKVGRFVAELKRLNKTIIFETDDLVYDPAFLVHMDYYQKMNAFEKKLYEKGLGGEILSDPAVQVCTTTTEFLAEKLREKQKKVFIVSNKLSRQDVSWAETALTHIEEHSSDTVRVSYLSGTPSHNKDFATITKALSVLLTRYPQMRLVLAGPLDTESSLNQFESQIERVPFVQRKDYFQIVASMDINVAPLEIGNPFCESKSELKFFESGIVGVPTVASATKTFSQAISDGKDGFVAGFTEEWIEKIETLIVDADRRKQMGENARKTALEKYTTENGVSEEYYEYLRSKIQ